MLGPAGLTVKKFDVPLLEEPVVDIEIFSPIVLMVTLPVQTPATKLPVEVGLMLPLLTLSVLVPV